jgi:cold-inducible RNA-binding protein
MDKKLYVGNLPYSFSEQDLKELFTKAGNVTSAVVITDRNSGRSKGFGFVEMDSQSEAEEAIKLLNGFELEGREINVSIARPREERGDRRGGREDKDRGSFRSGRRDARGDRRRGPQRD